MEVREGVKIVFGGDASQLLSAANIAKAGVGGMVTFSVAKLAQMDQAARRTQRTWERSLTEISTLANFSTQEIDRMRRSMADLSTTFGQTFEKVARARYDVISAGFSGAADSAKVLEAAAKGAVGGLTDIFVSAKALVTILNAYELQASDAAHVNDLLFTTVQQGVTTYGELAAEIGEVASTAKAANVPLEELLALVATVTRGGISTPEAVTAINQMLLAFVKQGPEARRIAKAYNLDISNLAGTMEKLAVIGDRDLEMLSGLIPGVRGLKAAIAGAAQNGERFADVLAAMGGASGAGDRASDTMLGTYEQAVNEAAAATDRLQAAWGAKTAPQHESWLSFLTNVKTELAEIIELSNEYDASGPLPPMGGPMGSGGASLSAALRAHRGRSGSAHLNYDSWMASGANGGSRYSILAPGTPDDVVTVSHETAQAASDLKNVAMRLTAGMQLGPWTGATSNGMSAGRGAAVVGPGGQQPFNLGGSVGNLGGGISDGAMANAWVTQQVSGPQTDSAQVWADAQRRVRDYQNLAEATFGNVANFAQSMLGNALGQAFNAGESAAGAFAASVLADLGMIIVKAVILRAILNAIGLGGLSEKLGFASGGYAPGFAWGGYTGGAIDRHQRAGVVHAGEYVLNQDAVSRIGIHNLERMNRGTGSSAVSIGNITINGTDVQRADDVARDLADAIPRAMRKANRTGAARLATRFGG